MKKLFLNLLFFSSLLFFAFIPWSPQYQETLMEKVGNKIPLLSQYPSLQYPNKGFAKILDKYPSGKVPIFAYGSLINVDSATRSVSKEAIQSMKPVVAFGFKRIFNYKASQVSRWGSDIKENERAMLNISPTTTFNHLVNGVLIEVDSKDIKELIKREKGYDLVPLLVASWEDVKTEKKDVKIQIVYTFLVPDELREGFDYTQTQYYPVRGYLKAVQNGAKVFGEDFLQFWNETTYLGDGTTPVGEWDEKSFNKTLDTKVP